MEMDHSEKALALIRMLLAESPRLRYTPIPKGEAGRARLLRSLINIRPPAPVSEEFLSLQDAYLFEELASRGTVSIDTLTPIRDGIFLWQGDITRLACDGIVNAANAGMTGCYSPCHNCIDNCIHTYAGVQLRLACDALMKQQGFPEPTGQAKITPGYNLPAKYVLHTVGPIVDGPLNDTHRQQLADCYKSCLALAEAHGLRSIAFCCISTGVFMFPAKEAAAIAIKTVMDYKRETGSEMEVIFNVFKDQDHEIYAELLGKPCGAR